MWRVIGLFSIVYCGDLIVIVIVIISYRDISGHDYNKVVNINNKHLP